MQQPCSSSQAERIHISIVKRKKKQIAAYFYNELFIHKKKPTPDGYSMDGPPSVMLSTGM